tara:strand:+ start:45 stop:428 length:384 start_codon:yes stop_codon:yes gene_type:complete
MSISRKTKAVKLIMDTFNNESNAISVVDLVSIFKQEMNKTTVYRILNRLEESNILHSFVDRAGLKRYAKGSQKEKTINDVQSHSHFICDNCGISSCLPIKIQIPSITNYKINNSEHLFSGQCADCSS